ncbi:MAG: ArsR family transcriptional regulator [Candidatus Nitrosopolaris sp.]
MKRQTIFLIDESKTILLKHINNSPGIRYRELQRATGFANGVLAYHLKILEKSRRIKVIRYRISKSTRYYPLNTTAKESRLMEYVRRTTTRKILLLLLKHDQCTSNDIIQDTKKTRSTISWHLSRLRKARIISVRSGVRQTYRLRNKELVAILINKIKN